MHPLAKKAKRCGPCDNCGCAGSTQWRVGPPTAPTLCNACGVCWGRKKKLPSAKAAGGALPEAHAAHSHDAAPASPPRHAEAPPYATRAAGAPELEGDGESADAELLLLLSRGSGGSDAKRSRHAPQRYARPESAEEGGPAAWPRRRESVTARGGGGAATAAAAADDGDASPATAQSGADALKCPPATPVPTATTPPAVASVAAAVATQLLPFAWPAALWPPPPPPPPPHAFDLFRAEWCAAVGGGGAGWADAHRAWALLPTNLVAAYARRAAAAAALSAAGFAHDACAAPVLPSRVIAAPLQHAAGC